MEFISPECRAPSWEAVILKKHLGAVGASQYNINSYFETVVEQYIRSLEKEAREVENCFCFLLM